MKRRVSERRSIYGLTVTNLTALDKFAVLAKSALLVDASATGFLLHIHRRDLIPKALRENLSLSGIEGEEVFLRITEMDLEIDGRIARTKMIGGGVFEVAIDFSKDAPEYWRECLIDLLPHEGEF